ncbi:S-layer homology domain-containing protein [Dysosmobacter acutus]|uniref:S-layer homology domain-containing protein n=1 Tax=Dysosmobacter acutus TaxID=2841504 RepID=UPI001F4CB8F5|nr:S-layer homology domain-containing protein [Dysosmobacter acutus]
MKEDYAFGGWYTRDGVSGEWGEAVTSPAAGQTYYAKWVERGDVSGMGTVQSPYVLSDGAHIYALARILEKQPASDSDEILSDQLKADYLLFGYLSDYKAAYTAIQCAYYELSADITLSNRDADGTYNGFCGIPNFCGGSFDGKEHIITLDMDFSKYPAEAKSIGGVFANTEKAAIKNLKLAGKATGTLTLISTATLKDVGLLIGATSNGAQPTTLENITADATIDMTVDLGVSQCAYIAAMVGRGYSVTMKNCVNKGNFTAASENPTTNAPRVAGLVGHAYTGFQLEDCANEGTITTTGSGPLTTGDLMGTSSSPIYKNCVSSGSVSSQVGTLSVFSGMRTDCVKADGNVIRVTITGKAGDRIVNADAGINYTYREASDQVFELPVYYNQDGVRNYSKYMQDEHFAVNRDSRLFLYDLRNTSFTTKLSTEDAFTDALPFSSWATALPISTAEHLLWMQKAINDGDEAAIKALYTLGGKSVENLDSETARIVLRSAYYKLQNDVAVTGENGFTGIGDMDSFGGHFDGGGHTVTLTISETVPSLAENTYFGLFGRMLPLTDGVVEVRNLNIVSSFDLSLPMDASYSAYVGGLAGYASGVTLDNVNVTLEKMNLSKNGDQGAGSQGGVNAGGCFGAEFTWLGTCPTVKIDCTITADWPAAEANKKVGSLYVGGFAGHGQYGGSVEFIGGNGINANNIPTPRIGGIMGYSWSSNTLDGLLVKNSTGHAITMSGATAQIGTLIGYHTTSSAAADVVSVSADGVVVEGPFVLNGRHAGGLFGYVDTTGIVNIANCVLSDGIDVSYTVNNGYYGGLIGYANMKNAPLRLRDTAVGVNVPDSGIYTGALIGYMTKESDIEAQNSVYVTRSGEAAVGRKQGVPNAPVSTIDGTAVLDTAVLAGAKSFGDTTEHLLTGGALPALTVGPESIFALAGGEVTLTKAGMAKASFAWNGRSFYTSEDITIDPKALTADDVTVTGVNSSYASDEAAAAALDAIAIVYGDKVLARGTDYTVEQITSDGSHKFMIAFTGNYSGTTEASYTVSDTALTASAQGYTGVYDAAEHGIAVSAPEGAAITYGEDSESLGETNPSYTDAGTYVVYWRAEKDGSAVTGSAVVILTPATLTIAADNQSIYLGSALPDTYTYTVSGLVGNDILTTEPTVTCPTADAGTAGTYPITVSGAAAGDNYTITYKPGTLTVSRRSGGGSGSSTYSVSADNVKNGSLSVSPKNAGKGSTVTITAKPDDGYTLHELTVTDTNGNTVKLTKKSDTQYTFTMPGSKVTVKAVFARIKQPGTGFIDVPANAYYADAVAWAVEQGITIGTSAATFSPSASCTRAQMVTFLWRAAGSPSPKSGGSSFADVQSGAYYYDAVLWAVENGITTGTSATTFAPDAAVTRSQTVTFLYRAAGSPAASGSSFADVPVDAYYASAVSWAVNEGITNGTSTTTFSPQADCTRGQIVTFMYRSAQ